MLRFTEYSEKRIDEETALLILNEIKGKEALKTLPPPGTPQAVHSPGEETGYRLSNAQTKGGESYFNTTTLGAKKKSPMDSTGGTALHQRQTNLHPTTVVNKADFLLGRGIQALELGMVSIADLAKIANVHFGMPIQQAASIINKAIDDVSSVREKLVKQAKRQTNVNNNNKKINTMNIHAAPKTGAYKAQVM